MAVLAVVYVLIRTDNPVSGLWQRREAERLGFVRPAVGEVEARHVDLDAFRTARQQCTDETDQHLRLGQKGCRFCMIDDCLQDAGRRYHNASGKMPAQ